MSSLLFGGKNLFNSLPRLPFCPGRFWRIGWIHPILYIVLVQFILFFKSTWCSSSYSSYRPGAIHTILQIFLVKSRQRGKEFYKFGPPSSIYDDLCLFFCIYPSSTVCTVTDYCGTRGATNILGTQLGMLPFTFFGLVSVSFYNKHTWDGHARYWRCMFVYNQIFSVFLVRSLSNFQLCLNFSFKIFKKFPNGKIGYY